MIVHQQVFTSLIFIDFVVSLNIMCFSCSHKGHNTATVHPQLKNIPKLPAFLGKVYKINTVLVKNLQAEKLFCNINK